MSMLKFEMVKSFHYIVKDGLDPIIKKINNVIETISDGDQKLYVDECNKMLFNSLLSRAISVEFFRQYPQKEDELGYLIEVVYQNRSYFISLSKFPDLHNPNELKYVESIYIK